MKVVMTEKQLREILNNELAEFTGQLLRHVDQRIDRLTEELKGGISHVQGSMDGLAERLEADDQERAAILRQLERHERWHHQTADKIRLKLDYQAQ
jgi:hypothetical protein